MPDNALQTIKIIASPHLLFTGANGHRTYGITVQATEITEEECRRTGYCFDWNINDHTFKSAKEEIMKQANISEAEYNDILAEFKRLEELTPTEDSY